MTLILIMIILAAITFFNLWYGLTAYNTLSNILFRVGLLAGTFLLIICIAWPVTYYHNVKFITKYNAVKQTIETSRKDVQVESDVERTTILRDIIDINTQLAELKYDAQTLQRPMIPDEILQLEPLK